MRRNRSRQQKVQGSLMLPKDVTTHNQAQTLTGLFLLLVRTLGPTIVPRVDSAPEVITPNLDKGVKTSIETALISVCNRISELVQEPKRWGTEDDELVALYKMQLLSNIQSAEAGKKAAEAIQALSVPPKKRGKKEGNDEKAS